MAYKECKKCGFESYTEKGAPKHCSNCGNKLGFFPLGTSEPKNEKYRQHNNPLLQTEKDSIKNIQKPKSRYEIQKEDNKKQINNMRRNKIEKHRKYSELLGEPYIELPVKPKRPAAADHPRMWGAEVIMQDYNAKMIEWQVEMQMYLEQQKRLNELKKVE